MNFIHLCFFLFPLLSYIITRFVFELKDIASVLFYICIKAKWCCVRDHERMPSGNFYLTYSALFTTTEINCSHHSKKSST